MLPLSDEQQARLYDGEKKRKRSKATINNTFVDIQVVKRMEQYYVAFHAKYMNGVLFFQTGTHHHITTSTLYIVQ